MRLKGGVFLVSLLFLSVFLLGVISARHDPNAGAFDPNAGLFDPNAQLEVDEGITPDSAFYFVDKFFDKFADAVKVRQEKVAEIRAMIEEERYEEALEALERYKKHADEFEREVSPEQRDEARRSAAAIYNVLKSLESKIPDEYKDDFDEVIEHEEGIVTAVEIAGKIKELCEALSELDPLEYSRVCRTGDDSPNWHRTLDRELTEEQRQEAEAFFEIMSQCFETSGAQCRCEDISFTDFAEVCAIVAPLEAKCDAGDENSCDLVDELTEDIEDLLPEYLIDILDDLIDEFEDDRFEHYGGPRECEGITDRAQCEELIFRSHAPPECVEELLDRRGIEFTREYAIGEAERDCEEIMFRLYAPQECIERGITDFRECGKVMFRLNAPQECIDAGLTGENRGDERACRELFGDGGFGDRGGPGPGFDCRGIENPDERLACYDSAVQGTHDRFEDRDEFYDDYGETRELERQCAETCSAEGGAWSFSNGVCDCRFDDYGEDYRDFSKEDFDNEPPYDCALLDCFEGSYCDPYAGCVTFDESAPDTTSETTDTTTTDTTNITTTDTSDTN